MLIGYLRSRAENGDDATSEQRALSEAGCEEVVADVLSGRGWEQPALCALLARLSPGDGLVVPELAALGPSLPEVVRRMQALARAGIWLRSLDGAVDTTTEAGRAASGLVGHLVALNRGVVCERINAGLVAARARGRRGGRPPKLTRQKRLLIADAVLSGRSTGAHMARLHKVSEATVSRAVAAHRTGKMAPGGDGAAMGQVVVGQGKVPDALDVLPASVLDERLAIVGTSGSGKTYAAKGLTAIPFI